MYALKSISILVVLLFAVNVCSEKKFEFKPKKHTAQIETDHIWFQDNNSAQEKIGPELYADDTKAEFFTLVKKNY